MKEIILLKDKNKKNIFKVSSVVNSVMNDLSKRPKKEIFDKSKVKAETKITEKIKDITVNNKINLDIEENFNKILTEKEKKHIKLIGMKGSVLSVKVDSGLWYYYVKKNKNNLINKLNKNLGEKQSINNILFQIVNVK